MKHSKTDILNAEKIGSLIGLSGRFTVCVKEKVGSTNLEIKERVGELDDLFLLVANDQSAGRGRLGRTFFSPPGSGVYFSLLMKERGRPGEVALITAAAGVAMCEAIFEVFGVSAGIKWVNDVYINGRKVCGILAECVPDPILEGIYGVILGVGVNVYPPEGGFPPEIADRAGAVCRERLQEGRNRLVASFINRFYALYSSGDIENVCRLYRGYDITIGKNITVISGDYSKDAVALSVDDHCRLEVMYPDGCREFLSTGEISIKLRP